MPSRVSKPTESGTCVVQLDSVRERHRLERYRDRVQSVLDHNRLAVTRLYESGLLFSRHGTKVGRDLLRAHQHLLRVADLIARAEKLGVTGLPAPTPEFEQLFDEIEALLEKTGEIARRNKSLFQTPTRGL